MILFMCANGMKTVQLHSYVLMTAVLNFAGHPENQKTLLCLLTPGMSIILTLTAERCIKASPSRIFAC